jgi:hypothetical protein
MSWPANDILDVGAAAPAVGVAVGGLDQSTASRKRQQSGYVGDGRLISDRGVIFLGSYRAGHH